MTPERAHRAKSVTQRAISSISTWVHKNALRERGFRRQSVHLHRQVDGLFHGVHFQASSWGTADEGRFTINLSLNSQTVWRAWYDAPFPNNPATAFFPFNTRLGHLTPQQTDLWWDVDEHARLEELAEEIAGLILQFGLPFFDQASDLEEMLTLLRNGLAYGLTRSQAPVVHAIVAKELGFVAEAQEQLSRAIAESKGSGFTATVYGVASRLGIALKEEQAT